MYMISIDLDSEKLKKEYKNESIGNAYTEIKSFLKSRGFSSRSGFNFTTDQNAIFCILTVADLTENFDWFARSVSDVKLLRIEEETDLLPIVSRFSKEKLICE